MPAPRVVVRLAPCEPLGESLRIVLPLEFQSSSTASRFEPYCAPLSWKATLPPSSVSTYAVLGVSAMCPYLAVRREPSGLPTPRAAVNRDIKTRLGARDTTHWAAATSSDRWS